MDALSNFVDKESTGNLFLKFKPDEPVKLRVLTNDPIVTIDKWANTRFNFVVWNWNENKPQVLSKGASILKQFKAIHTDPDYGDIRDIDVKITATGEGMETRYTVMPLPKSQELTADIINEAKQIDLEKVTKGGIRLSKYNDGEQPEAPETELEDVDEPAQSGYAHAKAVAESIKNKQAVDEVFEPTDDQEIDLSVIPF